MAQVLQFARQAGSFDPDDLRILSTAYDQALSLLKGHASDEVCTVIAGRIVDAGMNGERNVIALCTTALRGIAASASRF